MVFSGKRVYCYLLFLYTLVPFTVPFSTSINGTKSILSEPTTSLDEVTVNSNGAFRPNVSKTDFTQLHPKGTLMRMGILVDTVLDFTQHDECTKGASVQRSGHPFLKDRASSNFQKPSLSDRSVVLASEVMFLFTWNWAVRGFPIPFFMYLYIYITAH